MAKYLLVRLETCLGPFPFSTTRQTTWPSTPSMLAYKAKSTLDAIQVVFDHCRNVRQRLATTSCGRVDLKLGQAPPLGAAVRHANLDGDVISILLAWHESAKIHLSTGPHRGSAETTAVLRRCFLPTFVRCGFACGLG